MHVIISHVLRPHPAADVIVLSANGLYNIIMYKMLVTFIRVVGDIFLRFYLFTPFIWPPLHTRGISAMEPAQSLNKTTIPYFNLQN